MRERRVEGSKDGRPAVLYATDFQSSFGRHARTQEKYDDLIVLYARNTSLFRVVHG